MLTTSTEYKNVVAQNSRHFLVKVEIENVIYTGIKGFKYKGGTNASDHVTFGDTVSACIEFTLTDVPKNMILLGKQAKIYIGLQLSANIEWIPLGVFVLEKPIKSDVYLKITAYDNFTLCQKGFFSDLKGKQPINLILEEQCKKIGINYAGGDDGATYDVDSLQGFTMQEAIGYLSSYCGTNAIMDRNGDLKLVWYQDNTLTISNDRYASPIDMDEDDTYINRLNCVTDEKTQLTVGTGIGINFTCPGMTQERLLVLYNKVKGFTYRAMKLTWKMAQPDILAGDIVTVIDKDAHIYKLPLMSIELSCDGGCFGTLESKAKTQTQQDNQYKGPIQTKIDYTYTETIATKKLVTETIEAWTGKFETIDTNYLNVNKKLTASEAEIDDLKATSITTKIFEAELTKINEAIIGKLDLTEFTAVSGKVDTMEIDLNKVNTLLAGSVTTGSTQTIVLNAENTTIANALIKSAMIASLSADKVTAGTIDTSSIHLKSVSGNMDIFDNTLLIKDATRSRVQIGKDAAGDYNIYVWDKTGKLMFDATGVTADGIQKPIIRNDMVSPNANIDGSKINITSLVTEINGSTTKINSSHVLYDGRSLDIAFNEMQTTVDGNNTTIGNLSTQLTVQQGKIATLITDTSQTKQDLTDTKGTVTMLQTNYSSLQQTVTGLSATVGQHTSSITKVSNDLDNLQISGRNLIKKSSFDTLDKTYWTVTADSIVTTGIADPNGGKRALHLKVAQANSFILLARGRQVFPYTGVYSLSIWLRGNKTGKVDVTLNSSSAHPTGKYITCDVTTTWQKFTLTCNVDNLSLLYDFVIGGYNSWVDLTLELDVAFPMLVSGNKPTDWSPAPEDTVSDIKAVSDKQTTFEATLNGISGKVSSIESTTTSHTNSINGLTMTVNETKSAVANLKLDYDGFKVNVSNTYATKQTVDVLGNKFSEYSTTTQMNSAIDQKTNEIKLTAEQSEVNQYYYQNGAGNLFNNCAQSLSGNNKTVADMVFIGDVTKLKGKDISISVNVTYRSFTGHFVCGFSVTYINGQIKRYEFKLSPYAKLLPYQLAHGVLQSYSGRLSNTMTLDNINIRSISNLDMRIDGTGTESRIWNPKAEIGEPTGLTQALSGINTKVEKASLAVSPQQILGTISSAIDGGNSISTVAMLLNKEGLTVYNGAFKILNSGGDKVLYADLDGNLTIKGKIYATEGDFSGHITYAQIDGANINISQDARIGNTLYLGSATDKAAYRYISLNGSVIAPNSDVVGDVLFYRQSEVGLHSGNRCSINAGNGVGGGGVSVDLDSGYSKINLSAQKVISSVGITVSSDRRLKDKIQDVDVSWIDDLHVKSYVYKNMPDTHQIGIIAQDYIDKKYKKYFLEYDEESGFYGVSYGNITNALIQYCQELKVRVRQLETVIKQRSDSDG